MQAAGGGLVATLAAHRTMDGDHDAIVLVAEVRLAQGAADQRAACPHRRLHQPEETSAAAVGGCSGQLAWSCPTDGGLTPRCTACGADGVDSPNSWP